MNIRRFNYECRPGARSLRRPEKYSRPKWIRVSDIGGPFIRDSRSSRRRRIFAVVAPPTRTSLGRKTIRQILIFDNHPDSLWLVAESGVNLDSDDTASRAERRMAIICGSILIAMVLVTLLWPLLW
jgi:hypothetical protein